jgi:hypothetical protein
MVFDEDETHAKLASLLAQHTAAAVPTRSSRLAPWLAVTPLVSDAESGAVLERACSEAAVATWAVTSSGLPSALVGVGYVSSTPVNVVRAGEFGTASRSRRVGARPRR